MVLSRVPLGGVSWNREISVGKREGVPRVLVIPYLLNNR